MPYEITMGITPDRARSLVEKLAEDDRFRKQFARARETGGSSQSPRPPLLRAAY